MTRSAPRLAAGEKRYITPEGHAALTAKLDELRNERARLLALPEAQRASIADVDQRLALTEATLRVLTVLGPEGAPDGRVGFARWVTLADEGGQTSAWRIVGPDEADARAQKLSVESPLARALLGRGEGDTVEVHRPGGTAEFTIVRVSLQQ